MSKSYGGVTVMDGVDLHIADGEIHALLGANGAGKSTLIKCVSGAVQPDAGLICIGNRRARSHTPRSAKQAGVSVIYQDFSVAASLDVTENVFLGQELRRGPIVRRREQRRRTKEWIAQLGADLDPGAGIDLVGGAGLQLIEIMKALVTQPSVLILDEPTAALTEDEARKLADQCRTLKATGLAILYVTHRLAEVFELADTVTVMRGGRVVFTKPVRETTHRELVDTIAGRELAPADRPAATAIVGDGVLGVDGLVSAGIGPVTFDVRAGEVLGIYGLLGSGRTELLETLAGAQRRVAGNVRVAGRPVSFGDVADGVRAGVALVPSDRLRKGVFLDRSGSDNVLLPSYRRLASAGIRRRGDERRRFDAIAGALSLHPRRGDIPGRGYSGGNQQKLVVGRWLSTDCRVLLLDEPTQGVDVGARRDLYDAVRAMVADGRAAVVTSSEPEELNQLADRVLVLSRGRIVAELAAAEVSERRLLELSHLHEEDM
ncbi:MAG: sugar ABC transporter ATP-binding protein [Ilumatobacteraceae bacterium]